MNEESRLTPQAEKDLDHLLRQSFEPGRGLSDDFDSRVMASIRAQKARKAHGRRIFMVMMFYWAVASLAGSWLLADAMPGAMQSNSPFMEAILPMTVVVGLSVLFLARQSGIRLTDLFLGTVH